MNLCVKPFRNSLIFTYVGLLIFLLQSQSALGQFKNYFDRKFCEIKCGNRSHTLCDTLPVPKCDKYNIYNIFEIPTLSNGKLLEMLSNGHNGLRDRIANKGHIGNMVKVFWDDELAKMVIAYFKQCQPEVDDPCTQFIADDISSDEKIEYKAEPHENHRFIAQNRYRIKADFFPDHFVEAALRTWYREKAKMDRPFFDFSFKSITIGVLPDESNFTHLASPLIANFGCAIAQIDQYYELACNYYPFYRAPNFTTLFVSGEPGQHCPAIFPLIDESFVNICEKGAELEVNNFSLKLMSPVSCYILLAITELVRNLL